MNARVTLVMAAVVACVALSGVQTAPSGPMEMMEAMVGAAAQVGAQFGGNVGFGAGAGADAGAGAGAGSRGGMGQQGGYNNVARREAEKYQRGDRYGDNTA